MKTSFPSRCRLPGFQSLGTCAAVLLLGAEACSVLMDEDKNQCASDADCARFGDAVCDLARKVCVPREAACADPAHPPGRPDVANAGNDVTFTVGLHTLDWGEQETPPGYTSIGYDLDDSCTTATSDRSCTAIPWAGGNAIDGPKGRDNGIGKLIGNQGDFIDSSVVTSDGIRDALDKGDIPPIALLRIVGFSGAPDDDALSVEWYDPSERVTGGEQPAWDGTDGWTVTPASVTGPKVEIWPWIARYATQDAYVNDSTLVARFNQVVTVEFLQVPTPVHEAMMTAKLVQDPVSNAWRLDDAVVTGRVETSVLLGFVPELMRTFAGVDGVCMDHAQYPDLKRLCCAYVDLPKPGARDASDPCGFISFGARAAGLPVLLAGVAERPSRPTVCPADTDPIQDDCAEP